MIFTEHLDGPDTKLIIVISTRDELEIVQTFASRNELLNASIMHDCNLRKAYIIIRKEKT